MDKIPILYINLELRKDRNKEIIDELNKFNLTGERVDAIKHDDGYIGVALSHIKCLDIQSCLSCCACLSSILFNRDRTS